MISTIQESLKLFRVIIFLLGINSFNQFALLAQIQPPAIVVNDFQVNDNQGSSETFDPQIAVDGNGNFTLVWEDRSGGSPDIYAQRYSASGAALDTNFRVFDTMFST